MVKTITESIYEILGERPLAYANISGSRQYQGVQGFVMFYRYKEGTVVVADIIGLPTSNERCIKGIYGFHIHSGDTCTGTTADPFANAGTHYNPEECEHPDHAGDLPVLFENNGNAWMAFYTDRFTPKEIVGKTVIIHDMPDDYRSQPSGDSGVKIACGTVNLM